FNEGVGARPRPPAALHRSPDLKASRYMPLRKLEPAFHGRAWGSRNLNPWFPDAPIQASQLPIGEVWFETPEVPLLVKFLFTEKDLSVQVHPDDAYAVLQHKHPG